MAVNDISKYKGQLSGDKKSGQISTLPKFETWDQKNVGVQEKITRTQLDSKSSMNELVPVQAKMEPKTSESTLRNDQKKTSEVVDEGELFKKMKVTKKNVISDLSEKFGYSGTAKKPPEPESGRNIFAEMNRVVLPSNSSVIFVQKKKKK